MNAAVAVEGLRALRGDAFQGDGAVEDEAGQSRPGGLGGHTPFDPGEANAAAIGEAQRPGILDRGDTALGQRLRPQAWPAGASGIVASSHAAALPESVRIRSPVIGPYEKARLRRDREIAAGPKAEISAHRLLPRRHVAGATADVQK